MTVESVQSKEIFEGNGVTTIFPVPYKYSRTNDIYLIVTNVLGGIEPITSNYSITVEPNGDTSVLYPVSGAPLQTGALLTVYRQTPQTQIIDLIYGGAFNPDVLERDGFDRIVLMIQELQEGIDRTIKAPIDGSVSPDDLVQAILQANSEAQTAAAAAEAAEQAAANSAVQAQEQADRAESIASVLGLFVPIGTALYFTGETLPSDDVLADGAIHSATAYPTAASVFGSRYGGDGVSTFGVPDLRLEPPFVDGGRWMITVGEDVTADGRFYSGAGAWCGQPNLYCGLPLPV